MAEAYDSRFEAEVNTLVALHNKKQLDYGRETDPFANVRASEEWGMEPWVGALVRANDKMKRLQKAARGGTMANESVLDSFDDLAVYAVIGKILYLEDHPVADTTLTELAEQAGTIIRYDPETNQPIWRAEAPPAVRFGINRRMVNGEWEDIP